MQLTNTFITPSTVARMALATLYNSCVMLPLVFRGFESDFVPGVGATVTFRKPATFVARDYSQAVGVVRQDATETSDTITLDKHKDVSILLTSADRAMNLNDVQTQLIDPAVQALAEAVDTSILGLRADITNSVTLSAYSASTNPNPTFDLIDAGRILTTSKVPLAGRVAVADEYISASWRKDELSHSAEKRGDDGTALREASLGRMHGFDTFETNNIDDFTGVAFHRNAFAFVSRPLAAPLSNDRAEVLSRGGLSVRVVYSWDPAYKADLISLDLLYGVKTLDASRACLLNGLADSV